MKLSDIARYWAAKELTKIEAENGNKGIRLTAPFAADQFTLRVDNAMRNPGLVHESRETPLQRVSDIKKLESGTWTELGGETVCCFDLRKGETWLKEL